MLATFALVPGRWYRGLIRKSVHFGTARERSLNGVGDIFRQTKTKFNYDFISNRYISNHFHEFVGVIFYLI